MTTGRADLTPAALAQHAHALARAFDVRLLEAPNIATTPEHAMALVAVRTVVVAPIADDTTYAVALHELGHLIAPCGSLPRRAAQSVANLTRDEEAAAWEWAEHHALDWTPAMEHVKTLALASYAVLTDADYRRGAPPSPTPEPLRPSGAIDWSHWRAK